MKTSHILLVVTAIALFMLSSCSTLETSIVDEVVNGKHVSKMVFKGTVSGYEGSTIRGTDTKGSASWSDGDCVYIAFKNGESIVPGTAVYSASEGWSVSYDGDIPEGSSQQCEVRFFVNPTFANENLVTINTNTEIYEDLAGTFDNNEGSVTVTSTMTPKLGRIRFTGNAGDRIYITGITTHTTFSPAGNKYSSSAAMIPLDVTTSGSTPYVYGFFTYDDRKIGLVGSSFAFTRTCKSTVFQTGDSGYMAIPSPTSHNNWKTGLIITVSGVDFKMLPVAGYSGGFFLLAETETTRALYYRTLNAGGNIDSYPMEANFIDWNTFLTALNYLTSLSFYFPSKEEWQFAATGGLVSQGYTYSGSNVPGDVAWYAGNSGGSTHIVKQLTPNELGFYDMSGNAAEWTSTKTGSSSGSYYEYYVMGGGKANESSEITTSSFERVWNEYSSSRNRGLRLALRFE